MRARLPGSALTPTVSSVLALMMAAIFAVVVFAAAGAAAVSPGGSFIDDDGNVHEGNIEAIAAAGITRGCNPPTNNRYCPTRAVTRGEMAAFLARALKLTLRADDPFGDDDDSVFEADIEKLAAAGITRGCNPPINDRYCPDAKVTREQMAALLVRGFGYTERGKGDWFDDDDGSIFEADIDKIATADVTKGCNPPANTRYCPTRAVTRDQMASFIARAMVLTPITPPSGQPTAPIRAAFFYPWFPNAWSQSGIFPFTQYTPSLGFYDSADVAVIDQEMTLAKQAGIEAFI